jgi:GT2 family glycosyltransferase
MISAVVPTYRGAARLARNLPSVQSALAAAGEAFELIVVDDGGGGVGTLPKSVRFVRRRSNGGYGPAVNTGAAIAKGDRLLVLNDDVRLEQDTVAILRKHLESPGVFAVVPQIRSPLAACGDEGGKSMEAKAGLLEIVEVSARRSHPTLYPVGCCFLCPRERFLKLGGFDEVFAPFLWEDVDLGYRAWRSGYQLLHVPEAVCHHEGSATLREHRTLPERERMSFRNRVLFHLRNVQDPELRAKSLGAFAAYALLDGLPERTAGLDEALAIYARAGRRKQKGLADDEILARSRQR